MVYRFARFGILSVPCKGGGGGGGSEGAVDRCNAKWISSDPHRLSLPGENPPMPPAKAAQDPAKPPAACGCAAAARHCATRHAAAMAAAAAAEHVS